MTRQKITPNNQPKAGAIRNIIFNPGVSSPKNFHDARAAPKAQIMEVHLFQ
jgi:hypothetical protein